MKKRVGMLVLLSMLIMGIVHASSINGDYRGNPIVKVTSNGKVLNPQDVPAIMYHNRTMVPISLLEQLGVKVNWDGTNYSVNISTNTSHSDSISSIYNTITQNHGDGLVIEKINGKELAIVSFNQISDFKTDWVNYYDNIWKALIKTNQDYLRIVYLYNNKTMSYISYTIKSRILNDFYNGRITKSKLSSSWIIDKSKDLSLSNPSSSNNKDTYTYQDAVQELGFSPNAILTVSAKDLAIELLKIRQTKSESSYSVQDALRDLGIPAGSIPTLKSLQQAVELIQIHK